MEVRWQTLLVRIAGWLTAELVLGFVGLDDLADYSEFALDRHTLEMQSKAIVYFVN